MKSLRWAVTATFSFVGLMMVVAMPRFAQRPAAASALDERTKADWILVWSDEFDAGMDLYRTRRSGNLMSAVVGGGIVSWSTTPTGRRMLRCAPGN
jgi:hypothetical protein